MLADIALATFYYLKNNLDSDADEASFHDSIGWMPIVLIMLLFGAPSIGMYPILGLLMAEVYPSDIRSLSIGLTISASLCMGMANLLLYPYMLDAFHFHGTFYFYACIALATMGLGLLNIPDNRGLSLAKVESKTLNKEDSA